eukprot:230360_1
MAPEPPPAVSSLWQMASNNNNWSYPSSDNDTRETLEDEKLNKLLDKNGSANHPTVNAQRRSITRQYAHPKPPLHATHAIISPYGHNFDEFIKNNPYHTKHIKTTINGNTNRKITPKKRKKRIIRPVNAISHTNDTMDYTVNTTRIKHHRKESKNIESFLRHRMPQSELKNRHILVETTLESTQQKQKEKEKIKSNLRRKLSNKFRPQQHELYDRGIYVTNPLQNNPNHAAWDHANQRRRNSQIVAKNLTNRPPPDDVLNRGILTKDDYFDMFHMLPQTQPATPTDAMIDDMNHMNTSYDLKEKLSFKIKQRPSVSEMKKKGIIYDDPVVPVSLQNRKRELHRRRASKILEQFLSKRPKQETLKKRHIMVSPRSPPSKTNVRKNKIWITQGQLWSSKRRESLTIHDFLLRRPGANKLVSKHILPSEYVQSNHLNYDFKTAKQNYIKRRKQSRSDLETHLVKKKKRDFKNHLNEKFQSRPEIDQVPYRYFMPNQDHHSKRIVSKSRASLVLEQFLPVRPEIQQLWDKNILPSLPPSPHKYPKHLMKKGSTNHNKTSFVFDPDTIDKRRNRQRDSMAKLELKFAQRAPRESLFELGILKMSPAPSPPPVSVMKAQRMQIDNKSIFKNNDGDTNEMQHTKANINALQRKKRNFTKKRGSLVLNEFLGEHVANKLDRHLYSRPNQSDLIKRGIVPTYSFTKNYSNPGTFAKHRRNMTLELQQRLESKLKSRPLLNDLPKKVYLVQKNMAQLYNEKKIDSTQQGKIDGLLNQMKASHEKDVEELKQRYWNMMMEEKERSKQFETISNRNEMTMKQKIEALQSKCHSLSTQVIIKNTQMKEEKIEFEERLNRLKLEHDKYHNQQQNKQMMSEVNVLMKGTHNDSGIEVRLNAIKARYDADLKRERNMHRKFNEQSERVKQTLVDEINKMELQHQSKLHNLETQIGSLKQTNREIVRQKNSQMNELKTQLCAEIEKERNIATIMVEDLDEEKTRLIQEMNEIKDEYEAKLARQKKQIDELTQVAQDAVFYGNKAISDSTKNNTNHNEKSAVSELETKLNETQHKYNTLKRSKEYLEKQVLQLTQQILDTFSNNLNDDVKRKLNLDIV